MATEVTVQLEKQVADHIEDIGEDIIMSEIEDIKSEFLNSNWEHEFDSEYEAYAEQGRGEAESQILQVHAQDILGIDASQEEILAFMTEMACQLGISLN